MTQWILQIKSSTLPGNSLDRFHNKKLLSQNNPWVVTPVSVSSHYDKLIELVNAMKRIQKQNYYPPPPLHVHSSLKEAASYHSVLNWIIAIADGCSFRLGVAKREDIFPSSLKEHPSVSYYLAQNWIMVSRRMLFEVWWNYEGGCWLVIMFWNTPHNYVAFTRSTA